MPSLCGAVRWATNHLVPESGMFPASARYLHAVVHKVTVLVHLTAAIQHLESFLYHHVLYTGCFKKSFTTLKAYRNLYRGHTQRFELSKCSKTHRVLPRIVIRNCFDLFFRFLLHGTSTVTVHRPGKRVLRYSCTSPR
jgi:hypothetical protein